MKRRDKINLTWRDRSASERRSANAIQIHSFFRHYHLRDASFSKHDRSDIHDEKVIKRIYTLHDEIENESKFKSYLDIHKADDNRRKKRITTSSRWKSISTNKLLNNWRELVASSSFNCIAQVEAYALKIQQCVLRSIKIFVSWANFFLEIKFFWNEKCAETITTMKRRRKEWITLHIEKTWRNYLKTSNEKKRIIAKKKKIEFRQVFRIICDSSSSLWRLTRWARTRSHKSKDTSKISNFSRRNAESNAFEVITNFEFKIRFLSNLFFSNTIEIDLIDMSNFNYLNVILKSSLFITKDEIRQTIKRCKSNNASNLTTFSIAFSKYFLTN
jgi:hypothetical protein